MRFCSGNQFRRPKKLWKHAYTTRKNKFEIRISHFRANVSNRITNVRLRFVIRIQPRPQKTAARQKTGQNVNWTKCQLNEKWTKCQLSTGQNVNTSAKKCKKYKNFETTLFYTFAL